MRFLLVVGAFALTLVSVAVAQPDKVPLPADVRVVAPGAGTPEPAAKFSGKWYGVWDGTLRHILVVEKVEGTDAVVVYAWGDSHQWQTKAGSTRVPGKIENNTLTIHLRRPATVSYKMKADGSLDATYQWAGMSDRATLKRVE